MPATTHQVRASVGGSRVTARRRLPRVILIVLAAGAVTALGVSRPWSPEPAIVARVNGEPVTRGEVDRVLAEARRHQPQQEPGGREEDSKALVRSAVRKLIVRRLMLQEAGRRNFAVTEHDLDQAAAAFRRRFQDVQSFAEWMKERDLDEKSLRENIRTEILLNRVRAALVEGVRFTDQQVQEYYQAHRGDLKTAGEVRLRMIGVKNKAAADEILAALQKGADFGRLAGERSMVRAAQGGDMGWVNPQTLRLPLREAIGTLRVGETGGPLQNGAGFLLVRVEGRRPARTMSLAEARPQIERRLLAAKQQEVLQAWLAAQEKKSKIEVFLQLERGPEVSRLAGP